MQPWWLLSGIGGGLILAGLLIAVFPQLLVALISGVVLTAGIYMLSLGLSLRPQISEARSTRRIQIEVPTGRGRFNRSFFGQ